MDSAQRAVLDLSTRENDAVQPARAQPLAESGPARLVYILAASHSGSTLLTMLLSRHPSICTIGELKCTIHEHTIETYRCSCGLPIRECPFWLRVKQGMARRGHPFDIADSQVDIESIRSAYVQRLLRPLHRGVGIERLRDVALSLSPSWRKQLPAVQNRLVALVKTICEAYAKQIVIDSSKYALRLKYLLRNPRLDVRVIRLIRDGRGVALTYYLDEKRIPMDAAAMEWRRSNEEAQELLRTMPPSQGLELRYEALCTQPAETLRKAYDFIGVDADAAALDFRSGDHHIVGNWMRLQTTTEIKHDERWRTMLTPDDLRVFDAIAGEMNRGYGYE